jgi:hypothetical protein
MTSTAIRQKLYDYIRVAEDKKIKAIYTMLENEIEESFDYWNDKDFVKEIEKRSEDYKTGKIKGMAWEDAKRQILNPKK